MRASYTGRSFASLTRYPGGCSILSDNAAAIRNKIKGTSCKFCFDLSAMSWRGFNFVLNPEIQNRNLAIRYTVISRTSTFTDQTHAPFYHGRLS